MTHLHDQIYSRNPEYLFREEHWGLQAYCLTKGNYEIGRDGTRILAAAQNATAVQIASATGIAVQDVSAFLQVAAEAKLVVEGSQTAGRFVRSRSTRPDCLAAPNGLFWEITTQCNLRCLHCYVEGTSGFRGPEMETQRALELVRECAAMGVFVISLGGGEPFLRPDIFDIVAEGQRLGVTVIPVTNGSLISVSVVERLAAVGLKQIVVSLDSADRAVHNQIRGGEAYDAAISAITMLVRAGFRVLCNCVVMKPNLSQLEATIRLTRSLGVRAFRAIRLSPLGRAESSPELWLSRDDYGRLVRDIHALSSKYDRAGFRVLKDEAFLGLLPGIDQISKRLSWLPSGYRGCPAARSYLFVSPNGNAYPCGYLEQPEFRVGNLMHEHLEVVWHSPHPVLEQFRRMDRLCDECENCSNLMSCQGGCRATAYMTTGSLRARDPLCFRDCGLKINSHFSQAIVHDTF